MAVVESSTLGKKDGMVMAPKMGCAN